MRASNILLIFGLSILALFLALVDAFEYYQVPTSIQIGWFTILAEGFGFIGLSLVEITIFLWAKKLRGQDSLILRLSEEICTLAELG